MLGQEAVAGKFNGLTANPVLLARLAENSVLQGATVSIDAITINAIIATAIQGAGADYLLAVKVNQASAPPGAVQTRVEHEGP